MISKNHNGVVVEYDYPNIVEGIKLAAKVRRGFLDQEVDSDTLLAEIIQHMGCLAIKIEIDGESKSYEELLKYKPARKVLIEMADDVIGDLFLDEQKKS